MHVFGPALTQNTQGVGEPNQHGGRPRRDTRGATRASQAHR